MNESRNLVFDSSELEIEKREACKPHKELLPVGPLVVRATPWEPPGNLLRTHGSSCCHSLRAVTAECH